ncbi:MAG: agmatinase [Pseudomonadota bacterium]
MTNRVDFLGLEDPYNNPKESAITILPVPYEKTTSYIKGTAKAPEKIIEASCFVELYDEELRFETFKKGISTDYQLYEQEFTDDYENNLKIIENAISQNLEKWKCTIPIGGEHSITLPAVKAYSKHFDNLSILQIDAHADLREEYEGSPYSHACVMKRLRELNSLGNIVQFGIRSLSKEEADLIEKNDLDIYFAYQLANNKYINDVIDEIEEKLSEYVYLTIDVDGFDPAIIPAAGTPEPGGIDWNLFMTLVKRLSRTKKIVGFDLVELAPNENLKGSDFICAKMIYKVLGYIFNNGYVW